MRGQLRISLAALALAATACGSTVQQTAGPGAAAAPPGAGLSQGADAGLALPEVQEETGSQGGGSDAPQTGPGAAPGGAASVENAPGAASVPGRKGGGTSQPAPGAGGAPGTADRSPLRTGLIYVNNDAASGAGVDNGNSFGPRRALEALVASTNASGGLAGRRVQPTYVELTSSSSSYAADLQAACARFVDDAKVSIVLSFLGTTDEQLGSCLAKAGIAHVSGSYALGDTTTVANQPTTVSLAGLSVDRRSAAVLERLTAARHLTGSSRIGLLVEGCPANERAVDRTLLPTAKRLGLAVVERQRTRCFAGINDLSGLAADAQNAVLRFSSQGVDRVMAVSSVEANLLLVFTTAAESQGYRPGYALSSLALANVLKDNVPQRQLVQAKGVGWLPTADDAGSFTPTPQTQSCVRRLRAQGVSPASAVDHYTVFSQCDAFDLAALLLERSRGATAPGSWSVALDTVGTGFRAAVVLDGRTDFSRGRREGPALGRTFGWDAGCSCFRYAGSSFAL